MDLQGQRDDGRRVAAAGLEGPEVVDRDVQLRQRERADGLGRLGERIGGLAHLLHPLPAGLRPGGADDRHPPAVEPLVQHHPVGGADGVGEGAVLGEGFGPLQVEVEDDGGGAGLDQAVRQPGVDLPRPVARQRRQAEAAGRVGVDGDDDGARSCPASASRPQP